MHQMRLGWLVYQALAVENMDALKKQRRKFNRDLLKAKEILKTLDEHK